MSSDRSKLSCLKKLAEVEQYVWQDKRDPKKIGDVAQLILDRSHDNDIAGLFHWFERKFVADVVEQTKSECKRLLWIIGVIDGGTGSGYYIGDRYMEAELPDGIRLKTWGGTWCLEVRLGNDAHSLLLTNKEQNFFWGVLEKPLEYNCSIRRRDGTIVRPPRPGDIDFG